MSIQSTTEPQSKSKSLYDEDFYAWTQEQARLLKLGQLSRADIKNLIEEVEDMGRSELRALRSAIKQALLHMVKLAVSSADDPRAGWQVSVAKQRVEIEDVLGDNPSLQSKVHEVFKEAWPDAKKLAIAELAAFGERPSLPDSCPFSLDQLRRDGFYPEKDSLNKVQAKQGWRPTPRSSDNSR